MEIQQGRNFEKSMASYHHHLAAVNEGLTKKRDLLEKHDKQDTTWNLKVLIFEGLLTASAPVLDQGPNAHRTFHLLMKHRKNPGTFCAENRTNHKGRTNDFEHTEQVKEKEKKKRGWPEPWKRRP